MDINDLRIGDIVTTNGKPKGTKKGNYYRVIEIDSKNRLKNLIGSAIIESAIDKRIGQVCAWVDYLKPIPLTDFYPSVRDILNDITREELIKRLK